jgi:hypothetical protein
MDWESKICHSELAKNLNYFFEVTTSDSSQAQNDKFKAYSPTKTFLFVFCNTTENQAVKFLKIAIFTKKLLFFINIAKIRLKITKISK